jgi:hypothetical protein
MAVDYYHHLVVTGPTRALSDFVDRIALVETRRVAGVTHRGIVPFSFRCLYAMAKLKGDLPWDPYDMTRWRIVRRGRGQAEVRYRFHTRNLELHPLLKRLSKRMPHLRFALVTVCVDDMDFAPFTIQAGKLRGKWLGGDWRTPFWEKIARRFGVDLEEAYDDDDMEMEARALMLDAAVTIATGSPRRYPWGGGLVYRRLEDEQARAAAEIARAWKDQD